MRPTKSENSQHKECKRKKSPKGSPPNDANNPLSASNFSRLTQESSTRNYGFPNLSLQYLYPSRVYDRTNLCLNYPMGFGPQIVSSALQARPSNQKDDIKTKVNNLPDIGCSDQWMRSVICEWEKKWYSSPKELNGSFLLASNIYSLGVFYLRITYRKRTFRLPWRLSSPSHLKDLLLSCFETFEDHSTAMLELRHRILTPSFPLKHPERAGFCLWLLHPDPSCRPTTREILRSSVVCQTEELNTPHVSRLPSKEDVLNLLGYFLQMLKEKNENTSVRCTRKNKHYPVVEMSNKSNLTCICWNKYINNCLASADFDGVAQLWDASSGQGFSQYVEHKKRAWSVDFSQVNPMLFASGSDDCSVKLYDVHQIWDLSKTKLEGLSFEACTATLTGHTNHMVYAYYKSLPVPITSHRLGYQIPDSRGQYVSSVCWRGKSAMVIAGSSNGSVTLLKMV